MTEISRLLCSKKRIIILLMLAVINLALFSGYCRAERRDRESYYEIMRMSGINLQQQEADEYEQYLTHDYAEYLNKMQEQANKQALLAKLSKKSGYLRRNLIKTAKDFENLKDIQLEKGVNHGILALMDYDTTDYLLFISPLLLVLELLAESGSAVSELVRATKRGRVPLCASRIISLLVLSVLSVLFLYGGNLAFTHHFYGSPGYGRALQSIKLFQPCSAKICIGGYFLLSAIMKIAAVFLTAMLIWIILSKFYAILGWLISAGLIGAMYLFSKFIPATSTFNHLRILNLFTLLKANSFFTSYTNLRWFGFTSGARTDMLITVIVLACLLTLLALRLIGKNYPVKIGHQLENIREYIVKRLSGFLPVRSLFRAEGWKLLIGQKAILTMIVCALFGVSIWQDMHLYAPDLDTQNFYERYSGEITEESLEKVQKRISGESRMIQNINKSIDYYTNTLAKKTEQYKQSHSGDDPFEVEYDPYDPPAFDPELNDVWMAEVNLEQQQYQLEAAEMYLERYQKVLAAMIETAKYAKETGRGAWLVDDNAYQKLFQENEAQRRCSLLLLLFLIFAFSGVGAYDNRYDTRMLLRSTKNGRGKMYACKITWCALLTAVAVTCIFGIYLVRLQQDIGLPLTNAPAQSLAYLRWIPFDITLGGCVAGLFVFRFLAAMLFTGIILLISRFSRTPQKSLLLVMIVLLLPSALAESGISQFRYLDVIRYLSCCKQ
ncbi:MAG: hypothetical protein IJL32_01045 [Oscillospiraceae bacterium]|nr:hypothetical protein [Oscillospiraceae bacterium]